jgi:hypothetical protein
MMCAEFPPPKAVKKKEGAKKNMNLMGLVVPPLILPKS